MPNDNQIKLSEISDKHRWILQVRARRAMANQLMRELLPDDALLEAALALDVAQRNYKNAVLTCLESQAKLR